MSTRVPRFKAKIQGGKPRMPEAVRNNFDLYCNNFEDGTEVWIVIRKYDPKKPRSLEANNYYWGVVVEILRHYCGYEKDEMHDALGMMFRVIEPVDKIPTIQGTSDMDSPTFWDYIERVRRWAATDLGVYIPDPNETEPG